MLFACETMDKNFVIQNDQTNFEIRFRGVKNKSSMAKIIQLLNELESHELEMLTRVIREEMLTKDWQTK